MSWTTSKSRPGYHEKTLKRGPVTITVYRPDLSNEEQKRRESEITSALHPILASHLNRVEIGRSIHK